MHTTTDDLGGRDPGSGMGELGGPEPGEEATDLFGGADPS